MKDIKGKVDNTTLTEKDIAEIKSKVGGIVANTTIHVHGVGNLSGSAPNATANATKATVAVNSSNATNATNVTQPQNATVATQNSTKSSTSSNPI
jgi:hypothetical protein